RAASGHAHGTVGPPCRLEPRNASHAGVSFSLQQAAADDPAREGRDMRKHRGGSHGGAAKAKTSREGGEVRGMKRKEYEQKLKKLHIELVRLQQWIRYKGLKICIVFEGRDGAGKGGTIKAITERVSPRVFRVVALSAPTEREKSQMYVQRYLPHLPAAGEVVILDRSWYNRAGVERVMGFCTEEELETFFNATPPVEKMVVGP